MRSQNECEIIEILISMRRFRNLIKFDSNFENQFANLFLEKISNKLVKNKKNSISNYDVDTSFFSNMNKNHVNKTKKRRKKFKEFVIRKCVKIKNNIQSENQIWNESRAIFDTKTKINLTNHVYAKKFNFRRFEILNCDAITIDNHRLKIYDVYFV